MKRTAKRVVVTAIATGALAVSLPISSAAAIGKTACGDRNDLVKIVYNNGGSTVCFANAGVTNVSLPGWERVTSGNNRVRYVMNGQVITMNKWATQSNMDDSALTITRIRIL